MCCVRRKPAIKGLSHLQYEERNCAVPGWSHLQYKEKVVKCEEKVYSTRIVTSTVIGQGFQCKEKVCSIRNVASAVPVEKMLQYQDCQICSTKRRL